MKNNKKILVLALAALLLVAVSIGGTIAYLTATTDEVENTFSPAGIAITLTESLQSDGSDLGDETWNAKLIPGETYKKDPKVTLTQADCDVYIFITVADTTNGAVSYSVDTANWTVLNGESNVWYREAAVADVNKSWNILTGDQVEIPTTLGQSVTMPTGDVKLVFDAYAVQKSVGTAAQAWAQVKPASGN